MLHTRMLVGAAGGLRSPYGAAMTRAHAEAAHAFIAAFPNTSPRRWWRCRRWPGI